MVSLLRLAQFNWGRWKTRGRGLGVRGPGMWKTRGLEKNTGSGGKHGVSVENMESKC